MLRTIKLRIELMVVLRGCCLRRINYSCNNRVYLIEQIGTYRKSLGIKLVYLNNQCPHNTTTTMIPSKFPKARNNVLKDYKSK
jgi:hypothetical protein